MLSANNFYRLFGVALLVFRLVVVGLFTMTVDYVFLAVMKVEIEYTTLPGPNDKHKCR